MVSVFRPSATSPAAEGRGGKKKRRGSREERVVVIVVVVGRARTAEGALVRDLLGPGDRPDLVDRPDVRAEAAVDAEDLAVDQGAEREVVKDLAAGLPDRAVAVLLLAFVVEAVDLPPPDTRAKKDGCI